MEAKIRINPTARQREAWRYLTDLITIYILYGGAAGGGKTWLGCEWLLTMCVSFPGTRYFIGRNELKAIKGTTLETFYKVVRFHGMDPDQVFKYNAVDHYIKFHNGSRIDLLNLESLPSDPFFERLGSYEFTGGWIEEAGEIEQMAFDVLKSRINRCLNDHFNIRGKILLTANPKKNFLYYDFYKPSTDGTLPESMAFIRAFVQDNTYIESWYTEQLKSISNNSQRDRLLNGNWDYVEEAGALCDFESILLAFDRAKVGGSVKRGEKFITADIARFGNDKTVVAVWDGLHLIKLLPFQGLSVTESAQQIKKLQQEYRVTTKNIIVDADGVGGGVRDILACQEFINNSKAVDVRGKKENFDNLRSQCYHKLSEYVNDRKLFIDTNNTDTKQRLIQELEQVRLKDVDTDGRIAIISRKEFIERLGRSPDYLTTLMIRMLPELKGPAIQPMVSFSVTSADMERKHRDNWAAQHREGRGRW